MLKLTVQLKLMNGLTALAAGLQSSYLKLSTKIGSSEILQAMQLSQKRQHCQR